MKVSIIQDAIYLTYEHNYLVQRIIASLQCQWNVSWKRLRQACLDHPHAKFCAVLPTEDVYNDIFSLQQQKIIFDELLKANESSEYLNNIFQTMRDKLFSLHIDNHERGCVSIYLPVIEIKANDKYIVFCAKENISDSIFHELHIEHDTCYTGESFLNRFQIRESDEQGFYDLNHPSIFVQYIENIYFDKHNWSSSHPQHRVVHLFNPATLGHTSLGLTPHY